METRSETDRIAEALDRAQPGWEIEWADQRDLQEYARACLQARQSAHESVRIGAPVTALERLRTAVGNRIFHRVLNAALEAGIVAMPEKLITEGVRTGRLSSDEGVRNRTTQRCGGPELQRSRRSLNTGSRKPSAPGE